MACGIFYKLSATSYKLDYVPFQDQRGGGGWQDDRPKYDITCSSCGAQDQVPFPPTAGRDVYCKNCWREKAPRRDTRGGGGFRSRM